MQHKQTDAIVIGAGHNGLTTAAYLAGAGLTVEVFERRSTVGGCCVTEEIDPQKAPGCRVSTASYIASMLRPEVIRDLNLAHHGLRMVACEPGVVAVTPEHQYVAWWKDMTKLQNGLRQHSTEDASVFPVVQERLHRIARFLQPFFLESPPDIGATGLSGWLEAIRVGRRFKGMSAEDITGLTQLLTGSLGDFLDRHFESEAAKCLVLANSLYGKHGGPYQPGTAVGLLFHLLGGGEADQQGFAGHVMGGMGAITQAIAAECKTRGVVIHTDTSVDHVRFEGSRTVGVTLADGRQIGAGTVISNADPKRTFLHLVNHTLLPPEFLQSIKTIRMDGPCAKVNFVLDSEPEVRAFQGQDLTQTQRALFTLVPTLNQAEQSYDQSKNGQIPDHLWVDCVAASNVDPSLCPDGRHVLTCFVQFVPYALDGHTWDELRETLGNRVQEKIDTYAPGFSQSVIARRVLTPFDLEQTFGITEGNIFHGDISLEQLFYMRPIPGWSHYRTPLEGLYLCGAGTHPGGGVTGAPGYNAASAVLQDLGH